MIRYNKSINRYYEGNMIMGRFVNPDNETFRIAINSEIYVDKTGLIEYTNRVLDTKQALICNSRPRRFGKSTAADMLAAYYSKGCDSKNMFSNYEIGSSASFLNHLNKYDVIHFDVQWCLMDAGSPEKLVDYINRNIIAELKSEYPDIPLDNADTVFGVMSILNSHSKVKFVVIIDEWDILIRDEAADESIQEEYINFLRGMFKGSEPTKFIHLAYLTGILPIKKLKTQSALNNFSEFTMISPGALAPYFGFTEQEVQNLCDHYNKNFDEVKRWYDGYELAGCHIYNPNAVVCLMQRGDFQSYWSQTGTYEAVTPYINMDFDGLREAIIGMLSGSRIQADVRGFQNDMTRLHSKDDVLTLLIHLGYLAYDQSQSMTFIPNEELRQELESATRRNEWNELLQFWQQSSEILDATLDGENDIVAKQIDRIHTEYASAIAYNDENTLSSVLTIAYLCTMKYYYKPVRELPTGRGFADFVYIPKKEYSDTYPILLIELKWNKSAETAINQIKEKKYTDSLTQYSGNILLVGINYDKHDKKYSCMIEKILI